MTKDAIVDHRLPLAYRVGITGSRSLDAADMETLRGRLDFILRTVQSTVIALAGRRESNVVYRPGAPQLRLVSPLALGADVLAAEIALPLGYTLYAPLPLSVDEYAADFGDHVLDFRTLLDRAESVFALDGTRGTEEDRSYRAVGQFVVRNVDLLIAVWNGEPARGPGGTGDVVKIAVASGVPVWWIHLSDRDAEPVLVESPATLLRATDGPAGEAATSALARLLERQVLPPKAAPPHRDGVLGRLARHAALWARIDPDPLAAYLAETAPPDRWLWRLYDLFMARIAPDRPGRQRRMLPPDGPQEQWWHDQTTRADDLSRAYGNRYRSSYVAIFALAAMGVMCSPLERIGPEVFNPIFSLLELAALAGIAALVLGNHLFRWHERWMVYRLLAELCRKQHVLAPLGGVLPLRRVARTSERHAARESWAAWYFVAAMRAAPAANGSASASALARVVAVGASMFDEQVDYHARRQSRCRVGASWLGERGEWFFLGTLVVVVVKLCLLATVGADHFMGVIDIASVGLPAVSAASVGIRAYAEFEMLMDQSERMLQIMRDAEAGLRTIDLTRPLASQTLNAFLDNVTQEMLDDVQGWSLLFHTKVLEAG